MDHAKGVIAVIYCMVCESMPKFSMVDLLWLILYREIELKLSRMYWTSRRDDLELVKVIMTSSAHNPILCSVTVNCDSRY